MITPLKRKNIFRASALADNLIAEIQNSYGSDFDPAVKEEAKILRQFYDHRHPFSKMDNLFDEDETMVYNANSLQDYQDSLPELLVAFFESLGIAQLYFLDFLRSDLNNFEFENFKKKNKYKRLVGKHSPDDGYLVDIKDLPRLLPLFFFSTKYDIPIIFLITAKGKVDLSVYLCDDGNLHLSYQAKYKNQVHEACQKAGFLIGDRSLCHQYSISYLRNR